MKKRNRIYVFKQQQQQQLVQQKFIYFEVGAAGIYYTYIHAQYIA